MFARIAEQNFLLFHIDENKTVLEYGSGESTIEIANICKNIVSVEHQKSWYDQLMLSIPSNCVLILKEPNAYFAESGDDGTYEQFHEYVRCPLSYGNFDIILIDGRARMACASVCNMMGHKDTLIFIHDFHREEYRGCLEFFDLIELVDTMAKFKMKSTFLDKRKQ